MIGKLAVSKTPEMVYSCPSKPVAQCSCQEHDTASLMTMLAV